MKFQYKTNYGNNEYAKTCDMDSYFIQLLAVENHQWIFT